MHINFQKLKSVCAVIIAVVIFITSVWGISTPVFAAEQPSDSSTIESSTMETEESVSAETEAESLIAQETSSEEITAETVTENTSEETEETVSETQSETTTSETQTEETVSVIESEETVSETSEETTSSEVTTEETTVPETETSSKTDDSDKEESSQARIIVKTEDEELLKDNSNVIAVLDDIYILGFDTEKEASKEADKLSEKADFVEVDTGISIASDVIGTKTEEKSAKSDEEPIVTDTVMTEEENPLTKVETLSDMEENASKEEKKEGVVTGEVADSDKAEEKDAQPDTIAIKEKYDIALIDTGAEISDNVVSAVSVIGDTTNDDNGHGSEMVELMVKQNPDVKILSIKALDSNGHGDISAVIAAMKYAMSKDVKIINLSLSALATDENKVLTEVVNEAIASGIIVVGAAGNNGKDVKNFVPGNIEGAIIVGAADSKGIRRFSSNFGDTVDYYVTAKSTSYAVASLSGWISANRDINEAISSGFVFLEDETLKYILEHANPDYVGTGFALSEYDRLFLKQTFVDYNAFPNHIVNFDLLKQDSDEDGFYDYADSHIVQPEGYMPLYELSADAEYSVAYIDTQDFGKLSDLLFAKRGDDGYVIEDCFYDENSGLAYVPKNHKNIIITHEDGTEEETTAIGTTQVQMLYACDGSTEHILSYINTPDGENDFFSAAGSHAGSVYENGNYTIEVSGGSVGDLVGVKFIAPRNKTGAAFFPFNPGVVSNGSSLVDGLLINLNGGTYPYGGGTWQLDGAGPGIVQSVISGSYPDAWTTQLGNRAYTTTAFYYWEVYLAAGTYNVGTGTSITLPVDIHTLLSCTHVGVPLSYDSFHIDNSDEDYPWYWCWNTNVPSQGDGTTNGHTNGSSQHGNGEVWEASSYSRGNLKFWQTGLALKVLDYDDTYLYLGIVVGTAGTQAGAGVLKIKYKKANGYLYLRKSSSDPNVYNGNFAGALYSVYKNADQTGWVGSFMTDESGVGYVTTDVQGTSGSESATRRFFNGYTYTKTDSRYLTLPAGTYYVKEQLAPFSGYYDRDATVREVQIWSDWVTTFGYSSISFGGHTFTANATTRQDYYASDYGLTYGVAMYPVNTFPVDIPKVGWFYVKKSSADSIFNKDLSGALYSVYKTRNGSTLSDWVGTFITDSTGVGYRTTYESGTTGSESATRRFFNGYTYTKDSSNLRFLTLSPGTYYVVERVSPYNGKYKLDDTIHEITVWNKWSSVLGYESISLSEGGNTYNFTSNATTDAEYWPSGSSNTPLSGMTTGVHMYALSNKVTNPPEDGNVSFTIEQAPSTVYFKKKVDGSSADRSKSYTFTWRAASNSAFTQNASSGTITLSDGQEGSFTVNPGYYWDITETDPGAGFFVWTSTNSGTSWTSGRTISGQMYSSATFPVKLQSTNDKSYTAIRSDGAAYTMNDNAVVNLPLGTYTIYNIYVDDYIQIQPQDLTNWTHSVSGRVYDTNNLRVQVVKNTTTHMGTVTYTPNPLGGSGLYVINNRVYGGFTVSKTVVPNQGTLRLDKTIRGLSADSNDTFTFVATLSRNTPYGTNPHGTYTIYNEADNSPVSGYVNKSIANGGTIRFKPTQYVIVKLDEGTEYTFTETTHSNYKNVTQSITGSIPAAETSVFNYRVTLNKGTSNVDIPANATYSGVNFVNGVGEFTVGFGSSKTFSVAANPNPTNSLVSGWTYTVEEISSLKTGWSTNPSTKILTGTISANSNNSHSFINTFDPNTNSPQSNRTYEFINDTTQFRLTKTVKNTETKIVIQKFVTNGRDSDAEIDFPFLLETSSVKEGNANPRPTGPFNYTKYNKNGTVHSTGTISSGQEFTLKHEEKIEIILPAGTAYTVTEKYHDERVQTNSNTTNGVKEDLFHISEIVLTKNGYTAMSSDITTGKVSGQTPFVNEDTNIFIYTVTITDKDGNPVPNLNVYWIGNAYSLVTAGTTPPSAWPSTSYVRTNASGVFTVRLKNGDDVTFGKIPLEYHVKVVETLPNDTAVGHWEKTTASLNANTSIPCRLNSAETHTLVYDSWTSNTTAGFSENSPCQLTQINDTKRIDFLNIYVPNPQAALYKNKTTDTGTTIHKVAQNDEILDQLYDWIGTNYTNEYRTAHTAANWNQMFSEKYLDTVFDIKVYDRNDAVINSANNGVTSGTLVYHATHHPKTYTQNPVTGQWDATFELKDTSTRITKFVDELDKRHTDTDSIDIGNNLFVGDVVVITEITAPKGYLLPSAYGFIYSPDDPLDESNSRVIKVLSLDDTKNYTVFKDMPGFDLQPFKVFKYKDEYKNGTLTVGTDAERIPVYDESNAIGPVWLMSYYDNETCSGKPVRYWYFMSNSSGTFTYHPDFLLGSNGVSFDNAEFYNGSAGNATYQIPSGYVWANNYDLYYNNEAEEYALPLGSYTVQEVWSPAGYSIVKDPSTGQPFIFRGKITLQPQAFAGGEIIPTKTWITDFSAISGKTNIALAEDNQLVVGDAPTYIAIRKTDSATGELVEGVRIRITDYYDNTKSYSYVTKASEEYHIVEDFLELGHTYVLKETDFADGYARMDDEVMFYVDEDGNLQFDNFTDRFGTHVVAPVTHKLEESTDITTGTAKEITYRVSDSLVEHSIVEDNWGWDDCPVCGGEWQIYNYHCSNCSEQYHACHECRTVFDSNWNAIGTVASLTVDNVKALLGKSCEIAPAEPYMITHKTVIMDENGNIGENGNTTHVLNIKNEPNRVEIVKTALDGTPLKDVAFKVKVDGLENTDIVGYKDIEHTQPVYNGDTLTTNDEGIVILYRLRHTVTSETHTWSLVKTEKCPFCDENNAYKTYICNAHQNSENHYVDCGAVIEYCTICNEGKIDGVHQTGLSSISQTDVHRIHDKLRYTFIEVQTWDDMALQAREVYLDVTAHGRIKGSLTAQVEGQDIIYVGNETRIDGNIRYVLSFIDDSGVILETGGEGNSLYYLIFGILAVAIAFNLFVFSRKRKKE